MPHAPSVLSSVEPNLRGQRQVRKLRLPSKSKVRLMLMSDALARLVLATKGPMSDRLPFLRQGTDFDVWVRDKKSTGLLEDDDVTLVVVQLPQVI
jgi:hypothetical protein